MNGCDRGHIDHWAKNIHYLDLYRRNLPRHFFVTTHYFSTLQFAVKNVTSQVRQTCSRVYFFTYEVFGLGKVTCPFEDLRAFLRVVNKISTA